MQTETEDLSQLIERMSNQDFVVAVILNKEGTQSFNEDVLENVLREFGKDYIKLNTLFPPRSVSGENSNSFENIMGLWVKRENNDSSYCFIYPALRNSLIARLTELYGKDVMEKIKSLSDKIWKCAEDHY